MFEKNTVRSSDLFIEELEQDVARLAVGGGRMPENPITGCVYPEEIGALQW
jgi:hypothetical protein